MVTKKNFAENCPMRGEKGQMLERSGYCCYEQWGRELETAVKTQQEKLYIVIIGGKGKKRRKNYKL